MQAAKSFNNFKNNLHNNESALQLHTAPAGSITMSISHRRGSAFVPHVFNEIRDNMDIVQDSESDDSNRASVSPDPLPPVHRPYPPPVAWVIEIDGQQGRRVPVPRCLRDPSRPLVRWAAIYIYRNI